MAKKDFIFNHAGDGKQYYARAAAIADNHTIIWNSGIHGPIDTAWLDSLGGLSRNEPSPGVFEMVIDPVAAQAQADAEQAVIDRDALIRQQAIDAINEMKATPLADITNIATARDEFRRIRRILRGLINELRDDNS